MKQEIVLKIKFNAANVCKCTRSFHCPVCNDVLNDGVWWIDHDDYCEIYAYHQCKKCDVYYSVSHIDIDLDYCDFERTAAYKFVQQENLVNEDSDRVKLIELLGGKCARCPITDKRLLSIHHIFKDGRLDRKINWYKKYLLNPNLAKKRLEALCMNCHWLETRKRNESLLIIEVYKNEDGNWSNCR